MTVPNGSAKVWEKKESPIRNPASILTVIQGNTFLFTSESVGEGHPDKIW